MKTGLLLIGRFPVGRSSQQLPLRLLKKMRDYNSWGPSTAWIFVTPTEPFRLPLRPVRGTWPPSMWHTKNFINEPQKGRSSSASSVPLISSGEASSPNLSSGLSADGPPPAPTSRPNICIWLPTTSVVYRLLPSRSSQDLVCRRPSIYTGLPFFRYSLAISANRPHRTILCQT